MSSATKRVACTTMGTHMRRERLQGLYLSVIEGGRELTEAHLIMPTEGNLSARIDGERFLVTPTRKDKGKLEVEDLFEIEINSHRVPEGASTEVGLHRAIYARFPSGSRGGPRPPGQGSCVGRGWAGAGSKPVAQRRRRPRPCIVDRRFPAREPLAGPRGRQVHRRGARPGSRRPWSGDHRRNGGPGGAADDQTGAAGPDDPGWVRWIARSSSFTAISSPHRSPSECGRARSMKSWDRTIWSVLMA